MGELHELLSKARRTATARRRDQASHTVRQYRKYAPNVWRHELRTISMLTYQYVYA
jgi:hypothetical protein